MTSTPASVASLKKLSRQFPDTAEMHEMMLQLVASGNDRALVVTSVALLERALEEVIVSRLVWPQDEKDAATERKGMFEGDAPLATLSAKIRLGFVMGIYNAVVRDDLDTLRELRNAFAHAPSHIDFYENTVQAVCKRLKTHASVELSFADWTAPSAEKFKVSLVSMTLTGIFLQVASDPAMREFLLGFGISSSIREPPTSQER